jgi:hypothetical protein
MQNAAGGVAKEGDHMTPRVLRRVLIRLAVVAVVAGSVLGVGGARGQIGDKPEAKIVVKPAKHEPRASKPDGMRVNVEQGRTVSRMNIPQQNIVTRECTTERGAETKLGLMENTTVYGHCGTIR